jgi:hypothetical protein
MKWFYRISTGILTILASCRQSTNEAPAFLPGIYVNQSESEFCRIADTFIIRKNNLGGGWVSGNAKFLLSTHTARGKITL